MATKQELFTRATGLTFDVEKITDLKKLAWLIPDGAMLDNVESSKFQDVNEFIETTGLDIDNKVTTNIESTANNDDPKKKPAGKGWKKVIDVEAVEGVESSPEYWTLNGEHYDTDPTFEEFNDYEVISDEESWNASFTGGVLKLYYTANPSEDLWNSAANRPANFNDIVWDAELYSDLAGTDKTGEVSYKATWGDPSQMLTDTTDSSKKYYVNIVAAVDGVIYEVFNDAARTDSTGTFLKFINKSYPSCSPSYAGWIGNGAQTPWICLDFTTEDANVKPIFKYDGKNDVYPWGDKIFGNGEGHKSWGLASLPQEFGTGANDVTKLHVVIEHQGVEHIPAIEAVEPVEEQYHWERVIVE